MDYNIRYGRTYMYPKESLSTTSVTVRAEQPSRMKKLSLSSPSVNADGAVQVTVNVKNTGRRVSDEVI